jgi:hypothetical protein
MPLVIFAVMAALAAPPLCDPSIPRSLHGNQKKKKKNPDWFLVAVAPQKKP